MMLFESFIHIPESFRGPSTFRGEFQRLKSHGVDGEAEKT